MNEKKLAMRVVSDYEETQSSLPALPSSRRLQRNILVIGKAWKNL